MTTDPKNPLPPRLDPTCTCVCHTQPGVVHFAPCCRETDPKDAKIARYDLDLMESRMVKDQWGGEWVRYSDHDAEIARLKAALDESEATAEGALMILVQTRAERDAALAQVTRLQHLIREASDPDYLWGAMDNVNDMDADITEFANAASRAIRASIPEPDTLSRRDAQIRAEEWSRIETTLRSLISGQSGSLSIAFNEDHAFNYCEAKDWDGYAPGNTDSRIDWVSEEERAKAVANNTVWTLQCYPNTPVSFYCIGASSLSAILAAAEEEAGNG